MNDEIIKKIIDHAKPDQMQVLEALQKANNTIGLLSNDLNQYRAHWKEMFVHLATVLHSLGGEVRVKEEDVIPFSPETYSITVEWEEETNDRIVRLRALIYDGNTPADD